MKRRILTMLLAVCILAGMLAVPVAAKTRTTIEQMADSLYEAKLFLGAGTNERGEPQYQLGQTATRVQAVTMLVRILGKEAEAKQNAASYKTPFTDVPKWAKGYVGYVQSRSGLNFGKGIICPTGTIDSGYTGSIKVKLYNMWSSDYGQPCIVNKGDKIAQLIIQPIADTELVQVDRLEETERGNNGFGSTGR